MSVKSAISMGEMFTFWEDLDMKLKCTFCVEKKGNAVKTDQLFLVQTKTGDKLACMNCKEKFHGRHRYEQKNDSPQ